MHNRLLVIWPKTREEHDEMLEKVLGRARSKGVRFNPEKCIIGATEDSFFWSNDQLRWPETRPNQEA